MTSSTISRRRETSTPARRPSHSSSIGGEGEHRLAPGEGQLGPHLQDREVVPHQVPEAVAGLVVRGVRLVDDPGHGLDERGERPGRVGIVLVDAPLVELDPGLDHEPHHPGPGLVQPPRRERRPGPLEGPGGVLGARHRGRGVPVPLAARAPGPRSRPRRRAARRRPADPLPPPRTARRCERPRSPRRGARGDRRPGACSRRGGSSPRRPGRTGRTISRAFAIALAAGSPCQGCGPRWSPPKRTRSCGKAGRLRRPAQERGEPGRRHSRVASLLVHLVGGGLDEHGGAEVARDSEGGVDDVGVGRAGGPGPARLAPLLGGDHLEEGLRTPECRDDGVWCPGHDSRPRRRTALSW